jgi:hypothetical protein
MFFLRLTTSRTLLTRVHQQMGAREQPRAASQAQHHGFALSKKVREGAVASLRKQYATELLGCLVKIKDGIDRRLHPRASWR